MGWQMVGYLLAATFVGAVVLASTMSFSRTAVATGVIVPERGLAQIVSSRAGIVTSVYIRQGATVRAGSPLFRIVSEERTLGGHSVAQEALTQLGAQATQIRHQRDRERESARAQIEESEAYVAGLRQELANATSQIDVQRELVRSAEQNYERARDVASRGFISQNDLVQRREMVLVKKQQLSQLESGYASKRAELAKTLKSIERQRAENGSREAGLGISEIEVEQRRSSADASRGYVVTAPIDGVVGLLDARVGQSIGPQQPLASVSPAGSPLQAELRLPNSAAGFVRAGQEVTLAVDAFPYQQFGTLKGHIVQISESTVPERSPAGADPTSVPAYRVIVAFDGARRGPGADRMRLRPGMATTGRIVLERQSLLKWLFGSLLPSAGS